MIIDYTPPPTIKRFMLSNALVRVLMGPIGSGKSVGCTMELPRRAKMQSPGRDGIRRTRWVVVRNTRQQLRDTTLKTFFDWLPKDLAGSWRESDMTFTLDLGDTRAEFLFRPLDTPDDVRRLLSLEVTGAWVNEARELPEEIMIGLRSRCGRYPSSKDGGASWHGLIADTNYPDYETYWHKTTDTEIPGGWEIFKQPGGMEPNAENLEWLHQTQETLKWDLARRREHGRQYYSELLSNSPDWVDVYVHAKYGRSLAGRPVYERTFREDFHVAKEPLIAHRGQGSPIVLGMDFGRDPAVALKQMDWKGRVLTLDEVWTENQSLQPFLSEKLRPFLAQKYPENRFIVSGDPSGWAKSDLREENVEDILKAAGFYAVKAPTNDPERRIAAVDHWLTKQVDGAAAYLVSPTCKRLIAGYRFGYRYKRKTDGSFDVSPLKNEFSHIHDANQYGDLMIGGDIGMQLNRKREVVQVSLRPWC